MPHSTAFDLGLHCLPITFFRVSQLKWVNGKVSKYLGELTIGPDCKGHTWPGYLPV